MGKSIDWKSYNRNLINRGQITFWFSPDVLGAWLAPASHKRGAQEFYSDAAIEMLSIIRFRYGLTLRSTQGFAESIMELMSVEVPIPDYTTLCRRLPKLSISLKGKISKGVVHVVIDSTGLKVFGEGEWKVRQHGYSKRRDWMKLHLAVDSGNNQIISAALSTNSFKDNQLFDDLIDEIPGHIDQVSADGAYDSKGCYDKARKRGFKAVIPPRKGAKIGQHGNCKAPREQRDEHIREINRYGRKKWKSNNKYHQRSLSETAMYRFKKMLGDKLSSREFHRQANEVFIKCQVLNKMSTPKAA